MFINSQIPVWFNRSFRSLEISCIAPLDSFPALNVLGGVPVMARWLTNPTRNHEVSGSISALLSGLRIQRCPELWCRPQTQLRSGVAVALV